MMRALICDDDEFILRTLEHALKKMGYQVDKARNGQEALDCLRHSQLRLVVTDWDMPGMDGVELCRAVRREDLAGYVYIIMLTARDTEEQRLEALSAGADDFLIKPFNPAEMIVCLKTAERILSLETRDLAMFAMAKLAESRDPETGAHIERVQAYSRLLAQELSRQAPYREVIDSEYIRLIFQTSPLHDIGKVGIPDKILLKPGKLAPDEYTLMKSHVDVGVSTLEAALQRFPNARFLQMARDIAATHHEKFDGTGYPAGMTGEAIPISGRIVALADVYDALTSRRPYKRAMSHHDARVIICRERAKHFDPQVIDAFLATEQQFMAVRQRLGDEVDDNEPHPAEVKPSAAAGMPKVLIVEDDAILRQSLLKLLVSAGYPTFAASTAEQALKIMTKEHARLVLSDWIMPGMDGLELCRRIRAADDGRHVHFIMLTVKSEKNHLVEAFDAGVDDFVRKPFDEADLLVRLRTGRRAVQVQDELREKNKDSQELNCHLATLNNRLEKLAITDDLTGLFNRRHAMVRLDEQWALADRYGRPLTIAMFDIDHFKTINDTLGHDAGDAVLRQVAQLLRDEARTTDVVCRVGGEEFLIIFPTQTAEEAQVLAERCRKSLHDRTLEATGGAETRATISVGVASRNAGMKGVSDLLKAADWALYTAKRRGRNQVVIGSDEQIEAA